jgi:hypothetical protein
MIGHIQPRLRLPLCAAAAALLTWLLAPGSTPDRALFALMVRGFANPPYFISGEGSHARPWQLKTVAAKPRSDPQGSPLVVSLGDDPQGVFQSSPPSPIDVAVILGNFHRLGTRQLAIAAVLAWDDPDPIGLAALDKALARFDSLVMAAPLARGTGSDVMPAAFRAASLPASRVHGELAALPMVNRVPLGRAILARDRTHAGFQSLDSEPDTRFPPLLARWDDRIVFAFPVLVAMQRLGLPLEGVEIHLGSYLKLGPQGPTLPIDNFGRLTIPLGEVKPYAEIPAEDLIDGGDDLFPQNAPQPLILRDDHSGADAATRSFSRRLPAVVAAFAADGGMAPTRRIVRFSSCRELVLLGVTIAALSLVLRFPPYPRHIAMGALAMLWIGAQYLAASTSGIWLPGLAALAAIAAAFALSRLRVFPA